MDPRQIITLLIRTVGAPLVAWLAATGHISSDEATSFIITGGVVVVTIIWSVVNKFGWLNRVNEALNLPQGSSLKTLDAVIKGK